MPHVWQTESYNLRVSLPLRDSCSLRLRVRSHHTERQPNLLFAENNSSGAHRSGRYAPVRNMCSGFVSSHAAELLLPIPLLCPGSRIICDEHGQRATGPDVPDSVRDKMQRETRTKAHVNMRNAFSLFFSVFLPCWHCVVPKVREEAKAGASRERESKKRL
jgi:hypothetical protein